jgi:hypothetical protein
MLPGAPMTIGYFQWLPFSLDLSEPAYSLFDSFAVI